MQQYTPQKLRALSRIIRAERHVAAVTAKALEDLGAVVGRELAAEGYTTTVMDNRSTVWRTQLTDTIMPAIAAVYDAGFKSQVRPGAVTAAVMPGGEPTPGTYGLADHQATQYLQSVHNRMVAVADDVFRTISASLEEGRQATFTLDDGTKVVGESIPMLAARVDALLADGQRWKNRGVTVARTEVIAANNAGSHAAAYVNAEVLGASSTEVQKTWLATTDSRTRPTHAEADGQVVFGMDTPFLVGDSELQQPGDPGGDAAEVVNCRCTALYAYPGDPDYTGSALTASAVPQEDTMTAAAPEAPTPEVDESDGDVPNSVVVVALPAADDPVQGIGDEQKHATILFFGTTDENDGLTEDFRTSLYSMVADLAAAGAPITMNVSGVETLGDDDARVWMLDGSDLTKIHDQLLKDPVVQAVWQGVEQYPTYTPHVTIGYPADTDESPEGAPEAPKTPATEEVLDTETETAAAAVKSITFDRLACWWGSDQTEWPLGATPGAAASLTVAAALDLIREALDTSPVDALVTKNHVTSLMDHMSAVFAAGDAPAAPETPAGPPAVGMPRAPVDGPEKAQDIAADGAPFHGILAPEDVVSGDNREFAANSLISRDLPLPLMYQDATEDGHDGAVRVGRIDQLWRDTTSYAKPMVRYSGVWDTSDTALEAQRQVDAGILRGISIDGDQVTTQLVGSDGTVLDPMMDEPPADGEIIEQCLEARVSGGTLCSVPAFQQAYIANGVYEPGTPEPGQDEVAGVVTPLPDSPEAMAAAAAWRAECAPAWSLVAAAGDGAWVMPAAHFSNPNLETPTALTVDEDGRVYGHLATWGQCHLNTSAGRRGNEQRSAGQCMEVPMSASNYAYFATGVVPTDDGGTVNVGQLTMNTGHANLRFGARDAVDHYDNTGAVVADVTVGHDTIGIWFSGHLRPDATEAQIHALTASGAVSGDWREIVRGSRQLELVAALVVNTPGFPIGRPAVTAAAGGPVALVASGMIAPETMAARVSQGDDQHAAEFAVKVMAHLDHLQRVRSVRARARTQRVTSAVARLTGRK